MNSTKRLRLNHLAEEISLAEKHMELLAQRAETVGATKFMAKCAWWKRDLKQARVKIEKALS